jgi:hypothetical protein
MEGAQAVNDTTKRGNDMRWRISLFGLIALTVGMTSFLIPLSRASAATPPSMQGDLFWCTSTQPLCSQTVVAHITAPTAVTMVCWRDDRAAWGPDSSTRWFYVLLPNGQEGYAYAPQVANQVTVQSCVPMGTWPGVNWIKVADWATGHIGAVQPTAAEVAADPIKGQWGPDLDWSGDCVSFDLLAWKQAAGFTIWNSGNANVIFSHYAQLGMVHPGRPPRGALVFLPGDSSFGHVMISMGNWRAIGTQGLDSAQLPVGTGNPLVLSDISPGTPLGQYYASGGWTMPQTPTLPQNQP